MIKKLLFSLLIISMFSACVREELPNAEADILTCVLEDNSILSKDPIVENDKITIYVRPGSDISQQTLHFTLTDGAKIVPASGTMRDFRTPQTYTVTSQDGHWHKTYTVTFVSEGLTAKYQFETLIPEPNNRYHIFAEIKDGQVVMEWGSGNLGYALTGVAQSPEDYPTAQTPNGYNGKGLVLTTRSTGFFGALAGRPIAAGNLFIGTFDATNALSNPEQATQFGLPFYGKPAVFTGYYKYKAGDTFIRNGQPTNDGTIDQCHFYAVFYETDANLSTLDGSNVLTHPNIISAAVIPNPTETNEWTRFELPFEFRNGKSIDPDKLAQGKYNLAVVFTSSKDGKDFAGAVGSTLHIDEVEIIYEP